MKSAEDIIEILKKSFHTPSRKDEKIKVVVLCIVISTTFWFFSALNKEDYISQVNYPIEIVFNETDYIATSDLPTRIPLEVTGGGWDLMTRSFGFNMKPIRIRLNQPNETGFILTSSLRGELTPRLDPVAVNYILEDSLIYDIQKRISRTFKLSLDPSSITLDDDFRISSPIVLKPDSVIWTGPEDVINALSDIIYVQADLTNIDEDVDEVVDIPDTPSLFSTNIESTQVNFNVVRMIDVDQNVDVQLVNFPDSLWAIFPSNVILNYRIAETLFDVADTTGVIIQADYNKLNPNDSTIDISVIKGTDYIEELEVSVKTIKAFKNE